MLFSVIVPVYNVKKYLRECLESIREQTFSDFEVIIVDDGSTDGSSVICDEYANRDKRFTVIHKDNGGLVSARKAGAKQVLGEYVINVDSDDYIDRYLLESLKEIIEKQRVDLIAFAYKTVDEHGCIQNITYNCAEPGVYCDNVDIIKYSFMYDKRTKGQNGGSLIFSIWTKAVKREIYQYCQEQIDNRITKGEDVILNLYILDKVKSVCVSKNDGYYYRLQPSSMTHITGEKDIVDQGCLVQNLKIVSDMHSEYKNQIDMYIFYSTYMMLQRLVDKRTTYREYIRYVNKIIDEELLKDVGDNLTQNVRLFERAKVYLIKYNLWSILYIYFKQCT